MKHMIPLLVGSFFLVNAVSGYLNADSSIAGPIVLKTEAKKSVDRPLTWRATRPIARDERAD